MNCGGFIFSSANLEIGVPRVNLQAVFARVRLEAPFCFRCARQPSREIAFS
jgi:hypothetical protein